MNRIENAAYLLGRLDNELRPIKKQVRDKKTGKTHTQTYHVKDKEQSPKRSSPKGLTPKGRKVLGYNENAGFDGYDTKEEMDDARSTYGYLYKSGRVPFVPKFKDRTGNASPVPFERFPHLKVSEGYVPRKTKVVYRAANIDNNGEIIPTMIKNGGVAKFGEWVDADYIADTKNGGLCPRPGYHGGILPIQRKQRTEKNKDPLGEGRIARDRVWIECEVPDDIDWDKILEEEAGGIENISQLKKRTTHGITDESPRGGHYLMGQHGEDRGAEWVVAGQVKHIRVLGREEVRALLQNEYKRQLASNGGRPLTKIDKKKRVVSAGLRESDIERELPDPKAIAAARAFEKGKPVKGWSRKPMGVIMEQGGVQADEIDGAPKHL